LSPELLIAAGPGEWRAALLEDGIPVELFVERGDWREVGSIHLGRVRRLLPALSAILVDIGDDRPAFLPVTEVVPRGRRLDEGERVIVQIRREAQGGKAARLTTGVKLQGRLVELRWGRPGIRAGETLSSAERAHLSALAEEAGFGVRLLRPEPIETITAEAMDLNRRWRNILDQAAGLTPPARLDPPLSFAAALASTLSTSPDRILVDDPAIVPELRTVFRDATIRHEPEIERPVELDAVFDRALAVTIALADGGSVHVEATRTATMIDVDSGSREAGSSPERTGLAVNLAAAETIARQIRLRNLGGGIVVDFIGLDDRKSRDRICDRLGEALAADPAGPKILGWTRLGHLELVRTRRGRPLAEALLKPHPGGTIVKTGVTMAHEALRALRLEDRAQPGRRWRLTVNPDVAAALAGGAVAALRAIEERFGRAIAIETDPSLDPDRFQITSV
jgi:Rne/Rng family ribonuclease